MFKIFENISHTVLHKGKEFKIEGIEYDSRKIKENFVFAAMKGSSVNGHEFIQKAIDNGAKMIIVEENIEVSKYDKYEDISFVFVEDVRKHLGIIASNYYGYPQDKIKIIGITGTNGKTTSSYILENILEKTARIGTTGNRILDEEFETVNTTPESLELVKLINESVKRGVEYFIMEVSSHALEIGRVNMLKFDSAIFTNLTQDHLDFHKTMENYFNAKRKIFSMLRNSGTGTVNIDDGYGKRIIEEKKDAENVCYKTVSIKDKNADLYGEIAEYTNDGMKIKIVHNGKEYFANINLVGEYNLYNVLGCAASALALGIEIEKIIEKLQKMPSVPGRFETVKNNKNARIVVDYAHTDDGLTNIGKTLRKITDNRVITVFGAGGDRDNKKRPKMAKAAAEFSDFIILTSDNPRTENPANILKEVEAGLIEINFPKDKYTVIEDREQAIKYAVQEMTGEGDSLLIAGKGHETYQIIGKEKRHFDDREIAKKYLI
ncbi:UDP-N-acetylmuramoyl-L-alanyl-D-glutamate--2,6-diaminopimelate ligase [Pseudoleptotrichia goodfellowii]|uniref:UDP-N-acetylmuramoyl-L-alanyl-D-glutamate--2,6-diaminopimelate ligase n=1 Tax=Pseudoleptotrichia goodfellowii TaxID=157692 RepID=A0A510JB66_9FUSO|nr:UDP-N-acetylmuramoyl-L-alanyl-D-glutamate--2,6-diaminopimelate ligase [Pseudoleptotrichia goodfellowii]BBM35661.1 UDP-N-acetylmuramyl tripeptide synthetase [Pseudoleptotrichia goodfellowii]